MKLVIGNKNYSSWSLRPWLLLKHFNLPFEEIPVSLNSKNLSDILLQYSGTAKVPVLIDADMSIWDSLAICEYINENYLNNKAWPANKNDRAIARALCAEMHSGFFNIRNDMPMNCRARKNIELSENVKKEISRIDAIWQEYVKENELGEHYLFGEFSIADCFFTPVILRFITYGISVSEKSEKYVQSIKQHPYIQAWMQASQNESETLHFAEVGEVCV